MYFIYFILGGSKITADGDYSHEIRRCLLFGRRAMTNIDSILRRYFADKGPSSKSYDFSSSDVQICELDHKEGRLSTKERMLSNWGAGEDS